MVLATAALGAAVAIQNNAWTSHEDMSECPS